MMRKSYVVMNIEGSSKTEVVGCGDSILTSGGGKRQ